jgi:hypothetical protein
VRTGDVERLDVHAIMTLFTRLSLTREESLCVVSRANTRIRANAGAQA